MGKLTVDRYARLYHEMYGVDVIALRYFNVYGPRQSASDYSGVISIFREQATSGKPLTIDGDGTQTRDFVHVDDVVRANLLAAAADIAGEAYNVGTGARTSIRGPAEFVQSATETSPQIVHREKREGDVQDSEAELTKICSELGFEPVVDLKSGVERLLE